LKQEQKAYHVSAMDVAKRLLDFGFHAPTTYFPLLVPECLLIEPTETEAKEDLIDSAMHWPRSARKCAMTGETHLRAAYNACSGDWMMCARQSSLT